MNVEVRPPRKPTSHSWSFVGSVVVHHDVDIDVRWHAGLDDIEEVDEVRCPMTLVALADDAAGTDVEGREQRRCPVAFIVM